MTKTTQCGPQSSYFPVYNYLYFEENVIFRELTAEHACIASVSGAFMTLDRTDRAILHELQSDGRLANSAVAHRVNLSESACLRRIRNLEASGLIRGYVGLVDQSSAGYPDNVFVRITLHSQQQDDLAAFEAQISQIPEVMECFLMSGDADYLLRVIVADARDYERIHSQHLTRLPGVDRVHSSFALRTVIKKTEVPVRI